MAEMDPERVRAYLQVACAGLGFEIGEVWWTSSEHGQSTVAAIGKKSSIFRFRNGIETNVPVDESNASASSVRLFISCWSKLIHVCIYDI